MNRVISELDFVKEKGNIFECMYISNCSDTARNNYFMQAINIFINNRDIEN